MQTPRPYRSRIPQALLIGAVIFVGACSATPQALETEPIDNAPTVAPTIEPVVATIAATIAPSTNPPPPPATQPPPPATQPPPPPPTEPPASVPPTTLPADTSVSGVVKFIRFQAIADCDGIEGAGDFRFQASVQSSAGVTLQSSSLGTQEHILNDGEFYNVLHDVAFEMDSPLNQSLQVVFDAEEWDQDIGGNTWIDERIDSAVSRHHNYAPGGWTNLETSATGLGGAYPQAIQIADGSPNSGCAAELHYIIQFD